MPLARKDMIGLSLFGGPALPGLAPARRDCLEGEVRRVNLYEPRWLAMMDLVERLPRGSTGDQHLTFHPHP